MLLQEKRGGSQRVQIHQQQQQQQQPGTSGTTRILHTEQIRPRKSKLEKKEAQQEQKASSSGHMSVKVRLSDGRSDIMDLAPACTVSVFLAALSQKFGVCHDQIHSIRSGYPPKVLDRNRPQSEVAFVSGDRVEVCPENKLKYFLNLISRSY